MNSSKCLCCSNSLISHNNHKIVAKAILAVYTGIVVYILLSMKIDFVFGFILAATLFVGIYMESLIKNPDHDCLYL